jgi:hypothetical protein
MVKVIIIIASKDAARESNLVFLKFTNINIHEIIKRIETAIIAFRILEFSMTVYKKAEKKEYSTAV